MAAIATKRKEVDEAQEDGALNAAPGRGLDEKARAAALRLLARGRFHDCSDVFRGQPGKNVLNYEAAVVLFAKQHEDFALQAQNQRGLTPAINDCGQRVVEAVVHHHKILLQAADADRPSTGAAEEVESPETRANLIKGSWKDFIGAYDVFALHLMESTWGKSHSDALAPHYRSLCASPQMLNKAYWEVVDREDLRGYLDRVDLPMPKNIGYEGARQYRR